MNTSQLPSVVSHKSSSVTEKSVGLKLLSNSQYLLKNKETQIWRPFTLIFKWVRSWYNGVQEPLRLEMACSCHSSLTSLTYSNHPHLPWESARLLLIFLLMSAVLMSVLLLTFSRGTSFCNCCLKTVRTVCPPWINFNISGFKGMDLRLTTRLVRKSPLQEVNSEDTIWTADFVSISLLLSWSGLSNSFWLTAKKLKNHYFVL